MDEVRLMGLEDLLRIFVRCGAGSSPGRAAEVALVERLGSKELMEAVLEARQELGLPLIL